MLGENVEINEENIESGKLSTGSHINNNIQSSHINMVSNFLWAEWTLVV